MHRFFIDAALVNNNTAPLSPAEARHALNVLRLKDGAPVQALDGRGSAWSGWIRTNDGNVYIELGEPLVSNEAPVRVTLYMGLPKGDKLELISQKLTEIGVSQLVPVRMERCVAKIEPSEAEKKLSRARRISQEAQKQSGRQCALEISDPVDMSRLPELVSSHARCFLLWEEARGRRLYDERTDDPDVRDIACIVGPEGGISEKEARMLESAGARAITLGPRILRAETAAIAGCAAILTLWGDL
ncbi:MAG: 16S rRNA (uracil(1498)-N(3))-methyltransferase [Clostridia bacterium]|nr:16S rRNA (uracil(1498)-N(3))-methyltransferase [Clostridia bacterium]